MVDKFWEDDELTPAAKKGVIKLLPNSEERSLLTNWRPITLLGITYKLVSKIIANRIKPLLPGLISGQQTGFIPGRTIFDNILSLKLGEEWALESGQEAIFLKLNFIKAYDRIRHSFLWDTLESMGFSTKVIRLIQGLMKGAEALVHQNGDFTDAFSMERGVRQGCPLAPFLFSLSIEPLMILLQQAADEGKLTGIKLSEDSQLLHSLFADDTGLCLKATRANFEEAKNLVEKFERISGARLNVAKSLIIPIGLDTIPRWLLETGCKVAAEGEVWTYLGTPTGVKVSEEQLETFLLEKLKKGKSEGGLGLCTFREQAAVLKMRLVSRMLEGEKADWILAAESLILKNFFQKPANQGKSRTTAEILLLEMPGKIRSSKTLQHILEGWIQSRKKMEVCNNEEKICSQTGVDKLIAAGGGYRKSRDKGWTVVLRRLRTMGVDTLRDLNAGPLNRLLAADRLGVLPDRGVSISGPLTGPMEFLKKWAEAADCGGTAITRANHWKWANAGEREDSKTWHRSNQKWRELIKVDYRMREKANASWGVSWDTQKWENLWKKLWQSTLYPWDKLFLWRVINKGFFTLERAATIGFSTPRCTRCNQGTENIEHLFYGCSMVKYSWDKLENLHNTARGGGGLITSLIQLLEKAVKPENAALLISAVIQLRHIWRRRCKAVYETSTPREPVVAVCVPIEVILQESARTIKSLQTKFRAPSMQEKIRTVSKTIALMRWHLTGRQRAQNFDAYESESQPTAVTPLAEDTSQLESRRMSRSDAVAGRQSKERSTDVVVDHPTAIRQCLEGSNTEAGGSTQGRQWNRMSELSLLGFEEICLSSS
ncbi:hypothetical protein R1sor_021110 [Riccia sorocarpa]|uniref:Reverse transcriptase domain-containing protein n=1 Tax=Riccia sorocarpa TaxID=122646 RepID=A0ABD3GLT9_9MARC